MGAIATSAASAGISAAGAAGTNAAKAEGTASKVMDLFTANIDAAMKDAASSKKGINDIQV